MASVLQCPSKVRRAILVRYLTIIAVFGLIAGEAFADQGGPDLFGYRFADQADGTVYDYVDISATGTLIVSGDEVTGTVPLGAPLTLYGQDLNDLAVSTNGFITDVAGATPDPTNDCPLPMVPNEAPGSLRVAVLHDDLITDVRYQYFNEAQAAAVGYPGQTLGMSVIQWSGQHFPGVGELVDVELLLFHLSGSLLTMVAVDDHNGAGSTVGIQHPDGLVGLNYGCNTNGFLVPGSTAVEYIPGPPPDSDCCTPSASAAPGCTQSPCQTAVCESLGACCTTQWDAACANAASQDVCPLLCTGTPPNVVINEVRVDQTGQDDDEYFELTGIPGTSLHELAYIVLGDSPSGEIEEVVRLDGQFIPPSGLFVAAQSTFSLGLADMTVPLNFEDDDTVTHMLVGEFGGQVGDDLDGDGDGTLDATPWSAQLDTVVILEPNGEELPYGPASSCVQSPTCQAIGTPGDTPTQIFRCDTGLEIWNVGNVDVAALPTTDTPGATNICYVCGDGNLELGEDCDDAGESATCDIDCTDVICGDGTLNETAGEVCDDAGESETCDEDCTLPECGDDTLNPMAGEQCDDGNVDDGDGCSAQCEIEADPTTDGADSTGGTTTGDATGDTTTDDGSPGDASVGTTGGQASTTGSPGAGMPNQGGGVGAGGGVDPGCGCTSKPRGDAPWCLLTLFGVVLLGRRRVA